MNAFQELWHAGNPGWEWSWRRRGPAKCGLHPCQRKLLSQGNILERMAVSHCPGRHSITGRCEICKVVSYSKAPSPQIPQTPALRIRLSMLLVAQELQGRWLREGCHRPQPPVVPRLSTQLPLHGPQWQYAVGSGRPCGSQGHSNLQAVCPHSVPGTRCS